MGLEVQGKTRRGNYLVSTEPKDAKVVRGVVGRLVTRCHCLLVPVLTTATSLSIVTTKKTPNGETEGGQVLISEET